MESSGCRGRRCGGPGRRCRCRRARRRRARGGPGRRRWRPTWTFSPAGTITSIRPTSPSSSMVLAVERGQVLHLGSGRGRSRRRRCRRLAGTSAAASGRRVMSAPSTSLRRWSPAQADGGEQADQDQPTGPAVERADQQHHAAGRRRPGRGTPSRRPARRPGRRCPSTPTAERGQRHGEPEQDRAALARVARPRRQVRRGDGRAGGAAVARRRRERGPWSGRAACGTGGATVRAGACGRRSTKVRTSSATSATSASGHGNPKLSDGVAQQTSSAARTPTTIEGDGAAAVVEAERRRWPSRPRGAAASRRRTAMQPGAAEEDEHHEARPAG